ncbi:hypothetical protein G647_03315 [Cladophialophora carrionii CBS 160.54]|uniref:Uncharacterized protein n=1 Tax=Cladophialophora carrionii CBS 160.54 TaxID=1279043 RepID=V9DJP5_9EURO|nr:uncharacterized protein G647_03315 [Cladophialophora carrionii CBS 160.54]ETI26538.1 hypothetical protein G647_03315 [Cladophialophora carrionii CBS 160.54]
MFGPRRPRRRRRPRGIRHGEEDYWNPDIAALVPGRQSGYYGHGDLGEMTGPEFYLDPLTGRVNTGHNHDFTPRSRTRGGNRNRSRGWSINENTTENITDGRVASSRRPMGEGVGIRQIRRPAGVVDIHIGGEFDGFASPGGFGGRRLRVRGRGGHGARSRGGFGGMPGGGFDCFGPDCDDDPFLDMFDDLDLSDYSDDFGGGGTSGAWGEDPYSGTRGPGRVGRGGAGASRHGGGESDDDCDDENEDGVAGGHESRRGAGDHQLVVRGPGRRRW